MQLRTCMQLRTESVDPSARKSRTIDFLGSTLSVRSFVRCADSSSFANALFDTEDTLTPCMQLKVDPQRTKLRTDSVDPSARKSMTEYLRPNRTTPRTDIELPSNK